MARHLSPNQLALNELSLPWKWLIEVTGKHLSALIDDLFDQVEPVMIGFASEADEDHQSSEFFGTIINIQAQKDVVHERFINNFQQCFLGLIQGSQVSLHQASELGQALPFEKSEYDQSKLHPLLAEMAIQAKKEYAVRLDNVKYHIELLKPQMDKLESENPLCPIVVAGLFQSATESMPWEARHQLILYALFEKTVLLRLPQLYKKVDKELAGMRRASITPNHNAPLSAEAVKPPVEMNLEIGSEIFNSIREGLIKHNAVVTASGGNIAANMIDLAVTRHLPSPQKEGSIYQLEARTSGGNRRYEYRFEVKTTATGNKIQLLQGFSSNRTVKWDTSGFEGKNWIRVTTRSIGSCGLSTRKWVAAHVTAVGSVESLVVIRDRPSPQIEGGCYNIEATAQGGSGEHEYRFELKSSASGEVYQVLQDYSSENTLRWDTFGFVGLNVIRVSARSSGSQDIPVRRRVNTYVNPQGAADAVRLIRTPLPPQAEGAIYSFSVNGIGGSGNYEYRFEVKSLESVAGYQLLQDYQLHNKLSWNSKGFRGRTLIRVSVRNAGSEDAPVRVLAHADTFDQ